MPLRRQIISAERPHLLLFLGGFATMSELAPEDLQVESDEQELHEGVHNFSSEREWIRPDNPVTLERLEWFKDQKLALMMHWGPYSQLGVVESWALSDED